MRRLGSTKIYYSEQTTRLAKALTPIWSLQNHSALSLWQSAIVNPYIIACEEVVYNEVPFLESVSFPQTTYIDEPYLAYATDKSIVIQDITKVSMNDVPVTELYKIVRTQEDFFAVNYDTLISLIEKKITVPDSVADATIGYGDQIDNKLTATMLINGVPVGKLSADIKSKRFVQDQGLLSNFVTESATFTRLIRRHTIRESYDYIELSTDDPENIEVIPVGSNVNADYYILHKDNMKTYDYECDFNQNGVIDEEDYQVMKEAMNKNYNDVLPNIWNEVWKPFDLNKNGTVDKADMNRFLNAYPSSTKTKRPLLIFRTPGRYDTKEIVITNNKPLTSTYYTNGSVLKSVDNFSVDTLDNLIIPQTAIDATYDPWQDVYYYSTIAEGGVVGVKVKNSMIVDKRKFVLNEYYNWAPRGIKWKDGYVYLLIFKDKTAKILCYDTMTTYQVLYNNVIDVEGIWTNPTLLTINADERFVIGDVNKLVVLKNTYKRAFLQNGRVYFGRYPDYNWTNNGVPSVEYIDTTYSGDVPIGGVPVWNVFDEYALAFGLERLPGEENDSLLYSTMNVFRRPPGVTHQGLADGIQRDLRERYYTAKKLLFGLRAEPEWTRIRDIQIYQDEERVTITNIQKIADGHYKIKGQSNITLMEIIGAGLENVDNSLLIGRTFGIVYYSKQNESGELLSLHDKFDCFEHFPIVPYGRYIKFYELMDESFLKDPSNKYFSNGEVTQKFMNIVNRMSTYDKGRWGNLVTDESFYDTISYYGDVTVLPTMYDICPESGIPISSGIGAANDLNVIDVTEETIGTLDMWHPVIKPGFFYIEEEEYYRYNDKGVFATIDIFSTIDSGVPETNPDSFISNYRTELEQVIGTDLNDKGPAEDNFSLFSYNWAIQLDYIPDIDSPLIITEVSLPGWNPNYYTIPSGYPIQSGIPSYSESKGLFITTEMIVVDEDTTIVDDAYLNKTIRHSDVVKVHHPTYFEPRENYSKCYDTCGDNNIWKSGMPPYKGILYDLFSYRMMSLAELEEVLTSENVLDNYILQGDIFLQDYTPTLPFWSKAHGVVGVGYVGRILSNDEYVYNPHFNLIEIYNAGKYIAEFESWNKPFTADDVDVNPFNTTISKGYIVVSKSDEVTQETAKLRASTMIALKNSLIESAETEIFITTMGEYNRPISTNVEVSIERVFTTTNGIESQMIDTIPLSERFDRVILSTPITNEITEHGTTILITKDMLSELSVYSKGWIIDENGNAGSKIIATTNESGVLKVVFRSPSYIPTTEVVKINLTIDGSIVNTIYMKLTTTLTDIKRFAPYEEKGNSTRTPIYFSLTGTEDYVEIDITNIGLLCIDSINISNATDYIKLMKSGFPSEPTFSVEYIQIDRIDIISDSTIRIYLVTPYIGEVFLEYLKLEERPVQVNKLIKY